MLKISFREIVPSSVTVFQCFLFTCLPQAGVVAGLDGFVPLAPFDCLFRVGLQVHGKRLLIDHHKKKHLSVNLIDERTFAERESFGNLTGFFETVFSDRIQMHSNFRKNEGT